MTRDTFDLFNDKKERGRFGDNEARARSPRVTGASDLMDFTLLLRAETDKAIGVSHDGRPNTPIAWLPKSQCEFEKKARSMVHVTMPEWLASKAGLL